MTPGLTEPLSLPLFETTPAPVPNAVLSPDRTYRYQLTRRQRGSDLLHAVFIMLNPSTADEQHDDPTLRRCIGFCRTWGYGRLTVVNLFALRSTDPNTLLTHADPIGPENDNHIRQALDDASRVIVAWGAHPAATQAKTSFCGAARVATVMAMVRQAGHSPLALGLTQSGAPRHPLYLPTHAALVSFDKGGIP